MKISEYEIIINSLQLTNQQLMEEKNILNETITKQQEDKKLDNLSSLSTNHVITAEQQQAITVQKIPPKDDSVVIAENILNKYFKINKDNESNQLAIAQLQKTDNQLQDLTQKMAESIRNFEAAIGISTFSLPTSPLPTSPIANIRKISNQNSVKNLANVFDNININNNNKNDKFASINGNTITNNLNNNKANYKNNNNNNDNYNNNTNDGNNINIADTNDKDKTIHKNSMNSLNTLENVKKK